MKRSNWSLVELSRVLYVWAERGFVRVQREEMFAWAARTAALTAEFPRPELGIETLLGLGLARRERAGALTPHPIIRAAAKRFFRPDELPGVLVLPVFEALLGVDGAGESIRECLCYAVVGSTELTVPLSILPSNIGTNPAWSWLQQLRLAVARDDELVLDARLRAFVAERLPAKRVVSAEELVRRLEAQERRADLAEEYVLRSERDRLRQVGRVDLAEEVYRISLEDVSAGFDIQSFDERGKRRCIEVKSSAGSREWFFFSENELNVAREHGASYWLAWLGFAFRLPVGPCDMAWFRNPAAIIATANVWQLEAALHRVVRAADDLSAASNP